MSRHTGFLYLLHNLFQFIRLCYKYSFQIFQNLKPLTTLLQLDCITVTVSKRRLPTPTLQDFCLTWLISFKWKMPKNMNSLVKIKCHRHLNYLQIKGQVTDVCWKSQREGQFPFIKGVLFSSSVKTNFLRSDCYSRIDSHGTSAKKIIWQPLALKIANLIHGENS